MGAARGGLVESSVNFCTGPNTQEGALGLRRCITVVDTELLTFALTFLAAFLEPPPRSLALVPVVSGNFCGEERGHFQALEREGADRNGPLASCYLGQRSSISLSFWLRDLRVF